MPGCGYKLPFDLFEIASKCNGCYFAKKRFAAVQLAYTQPRCRVLVFRELLPCMLGVTYTPSLALLTYV